MNQTLKPDRPIWPSVPEGAAPIRTPAPATDAGETAAADGEGPKAEEAVRPLATFEGFGTFAG